MQGVEVRKGNRAIEEIGVGSRLLWGCNRLSWDTTGTRMSSRLVGLSTLGDSKCLLVKTAQCSSVSGMKARH